MVTYVRRVQQEPKMELKMLVSEVVRELGKRSVII